MTSVANLKTRSRDQVTDNPTRSRTRSASRTAQRSRSRPSEESTGRTLSVSREAEEYSPIDDIPELERRVRSNPGEFNARTRIPEEIPSRRESLIPTARDAILRSTNVGDITRSSRSNIDAIPTKTEVEVGQSLIYSDVAEALKKSLEIPYMGEGIWGIIHGDSIFTDSFKKDYYDMNLLILTAAMIRTILESRRTDIINSAFGEHHRLKEAGTSTQYLEYFNSGLFKDIVIVKYDKSEDQVCRAVLLGLLYANKLRRECLNYSYTFDPWVHRQTIRGITERIQGQTLSAALDGSQVDNREIVAILAQLTQALRYGYMEFGFRHNHLTLGNIILRQLGDLKEVRVDQYLILSRFIPTIINYSHATIGRSKIDNADSRVISRGSENIRGFRRDEVTARTDIDHGRSPRELGISDQCVDGRYAHLHPENHYLSDLFGVVVDMAKRIPNSIMIPILRYFVIDANEQNLQNIEPILLTSSVAGLGFDGFMIHLTNLVSGERIITNLETSERSRSNPTDRNYPPPTVGSNYVPTGEFNRGYLPPSIGVNNPYLTSRTGFVEPFAFNNPNQFNRFNEFNRFGTSQFGALQVPPSQFGAARPETVVVDQFGNIIEERIFAPPTLVPERVNTSKESNIIQPKILMSLTNWAEIIGLGDTYEPRTILEIERLYDLQGLDQGYVTQIYEDGMDVAVRLAGEIKVSIKQGDIDRALYLYSKLLTYQPGQSVNVGRYPFYDKIINHYIYLITPILEYIYELIRPYLEKSEHEYPPNLTIVVDTEKKVPRYGCAM